MIENTAWCSPLKPLNMCLRFILRSPQLLQQSFCGAKRQVGAPADGGADQRVVVQIYPTASNRS